MGNIIKSIDGLPVIDTKHPMTITVTQRDIDKADPKHPESCAAARACVRQAHALEARVHLGRVYVKTNEDHWVRFITPPTLRSEIIAFDRGGVFEPGKYVLKKPTPSQRASAGRHQGGPAPYKPKAERKRAKKRRSPTVVKNVRTGPA